MPIPLFPKDASFAEPRPGSHHAVARLLRLLGRAIGHQAALIGVGSVGWLARKLWVPLAVLTVATLAAVVGFALFGLWVEAAEAALFVVPLLGLMAGVRWVDRACVVYGLKRGGR